jgi:hypothetical protein
MRPVYSLAASCSPATMLHDIAFEGRKLRQDSPKPLAGAL